MLLLICYYFFRILVLICHYLDRKDIFLRTSNQYPFCTKQIDNSFQAYGVAFYHEPNYIYIKTIMVSEV